jgi:hypothetical protein
MSHDVLDKPLKVETDDELDMRQKLIRNILNRQKLVEELREQERTMNFIPQEILIQNRHKRLVNQINQLHEKYKLKLD